MSEQIKFDRAAATADPLTEWALCAILAQRTSDGLNKSLNHVPGEPLEVSLKINGLEFSFKELLHRIHSDFDRQVEDRAAEIAEEKTGNLVYKLTVAVNDYEKAINEHLDSCFPNSKIARDRRND
jgi:hypothetical protein